MPELHSNGIYENYVAQLFNPLAQTNPALFGTVGAINPALAGQVQNPWAIQAVNQIPGIAQHPQQQIQYLIQCAQQVVARQTVQAVQCVQALQAVTQLLQNLQAQQSFGIPQFGGQTLMNQAPHPQQALQGLAQYLSAPLPGLYH